jgi:hypothetical protein
MTAINFPLRAIRQNACSYFCVELDIGCGRPQFVGGDALERVPLCKMWGFDDRDKLENAFHDFPDRAPAGQDRRYRRGELADGRRVARC